MMIQVIQHNLYSPDYLVNLITLVQYHEDFEQIK